MPLKAQARDLVTDHVIIRWLERVEGYNFDDIRKEIKAEGGFATDSDIIAYLRRSWIGGIDKCHTILTQAMLDCFAPSVASFRLYLPNGSPA